MKKIMTISFLLAAVLTILTGCSDGTKKDEEKNTSGGGSVVVGITQDLDSLDPHKAVAAGTKEVLYNIFEGLVKPDKDGNLVAAVAESYQVSEDGMTYTFVLRPNVTFHNGKTVTAEDVIYSLKRSAGLLDTSDPEVQVVAALSVIQTIESSTNGEGKEVVTIQLSTPNTELLGYLTCSIIPCDYSEQASKPVGTGPFTFVSYTPMDSVVMERNESYYGQKAHLEKVTFRISESTDAAFVELLGGNIDIFPYLTEDQAAQLAGQYNIEIGDMSLVQGLFLNNAVEPFNNPLVRQAMCHAVDRQGIIDMLSGGHGTLIGSGVYASFGAYYDASLAGRYEYDVEKAKALLKEAGYEDGFSFTIVVPSNYSYHVSTAQVIVEQLKKVGVEAKIQQIEWASWLSDVYADHNFEATVIGLDSQLAPSDILKYYISGSPKNFINYESAAFTETYQKAMQTVDTELKKQYYKELQKYLADDAASVFLQSPALLVAVNPALGGYTFYPVYVQDMASVYYK